MSLYKILRFFIWMTFLQLCQSKMLSQCITQCSGDTTIYGVAAGLNNSGTRVAFFGRSAGLENEGDKNSFFGYLSGRNNNAGAEGSFFGYQSGKSNTVGGGNSFFGAYAGESNTSAAGNSFFGYKSGQLNTTAERNSFFGSFAGQSNTGTSNSFFGYQSGLNNSTGDSNTFIGFGAGSDNTTGSHNVYIGHNVNQNSVDGDKIDSTLLIGLGGEFPLIYGHFGEEELVVNGDLNVYGTTRLLGEFEAYGAFFGGSSQHIKQDFRNLNVQDILEKVSAMPITNWEYIKNPDVRHIGPMAQDFRAAFGLGKDDVTIATVDADGIAFASIQALHTQLVKEQEQNADQQKLIEILIERIEKLENSKK